MALKVEDLPKVVILEPNKGVRIEVDLQAPPLEIDLHLENEAPGRSFILMITVPSGEVVQRVRVAGHAKVLFEPEAPGEYNVLLTNPMNEPAVVRCEFKEVAKSGGASKAGPKGRHRPSKEYDPAFR